MSQNRGEFAPGGLEDLLNQSAGTNSYFQSLPGYIQEMLWQRAGNIHTADELQRYAENLAQGDK